MDEDSSSKKGASFEEAMEYVTFIPETEGDVLLNRVRISKGKNGDKGRVARITKKQKQKKKIELIHFNRYANLICCYISCKSHKFRHQIFCYTH